MPWTSLMESGDSNCEHEWGEEEGRRSLDFFMWWRVCRKCGGKCATRTASRGPALEFSDWVHGMSYVIGSDGNLAGREFRYLKCECGNSVLVDFETSDDGRVVRKEATRCDWCGARYPAGTSGPEHRPRGAFWKDHPEIDW